MDYERHTYKERDRNPINRWINKRLDRITERETEKYIKRYATDENGVVNEELAQRVRFEVLRRSEMGREIDVLEPGRWTLYSFALGLLSGTAAKAVENRTTAPGSLKGFLRATTIAGVASGLLTGGRILSFARFKSGLYAGAQTAIASYEKEMASLHDMSGSGASLNEEREPSWQNRYQEEKQRGQQEGRER